MPDRSTTTTTTTTPSPSPKSSPLSIICMYVCLKIYTYEKTKSLYISIFVSETTITTTKSEIERERKIILFVVFFQCFFFHKMLAIQSILLMQVTTLWHSRSLSDQKKTETNLKGSVHVLNSGQFLQSKDFLRKSYSSNV